MAAKATIIHSLNVRLDGTLTLVDRDTDETILRRVDISNPDGIDPNWIAAKIFLGEIAVPEECSRFTVRKAANDDIEVTMSADVISLVERLNG